MSLEDRIFTSCLKSAFHILLPLSSTRIKAPTTLDEARRAVSEQQLDILVYPDIGMEPLTYFMAFSRLAPVQVWKR